MARSQRTRGRRADVVAGEPAGPRPFRAARRGRKSRARKVARKHPESSGSTPKLGKGREMSVCLVVWGNWGHGVLGVSGVAAWRRVQTWTGVDARKRFRRRFCLWGNWGLCARDRFYLPLSPSTYFPSVPVNVSYARKPQLPQSSCALRRTPERPRIGDFGRAPHRLGQLVRSRPRIPGGTLGTERRYLTRACQIIGPRRLCA